MRSVGHQNRAGRFDCGKNIWVNRKDGDTTMAGQGTQRRDILKMLAYASAAAHFPGFSRWAYGGTGHMEHPSSSTAMRPGSYSPQFLNPAQYALLTLLTDIILPPENNSGDMRSAGAVQAGVREFIDLMLGIDW